MKLRTIAVIVPVMLMPPCLPPPGTIGPGGTLVIPAAGPIVPLPANATVRYTPNPWASVLGPGPGRIALTIIVTTQGIPTPAGVPNVAVDVSIEPGNDNATTSLFDFGINPATGGRIVGSKVNAATDASGVVALGVRSTGQGDQDRIRIVVSPGTANTQTFVLTYSTR